MSSPSGPARADWNSALLLLVFLAAWTPQRTSGAEPVTVTGSVTVTRPGKAKTDSAGVVVWLKPLDPDIVKAAAGFAGRENFTIVQKDKTFEPHVLAVPVGAMVAFPNFDPFFHNVFSMFDGRRFDLGLYEAGASRTVSFPKPGVSYIFCNIHPEMSAAVVAVDTPYYTVSKPSGQFSIPNVPPGRYRLSVWHERAMPENTAPFPREITIDAAASLGTLRLTDTGKLAVPHTNKYGRPYDTLPTGPTYR